MICGNFPKNLPETFFTLRQGGSRKRHWFFLKVWKFNTNLFAACASPRDYFFSKVKISSTRLSGLCGILGVIHIPQVYLPSADSPRANQGSTRDSGSFGWGGFLINLIICFFTSNQRKIRFEVHLDKLWTVVCLLSTISYLRNFSKESAWDFFMRIIPAVNTKNQIARAEFLCLHRFWCRLQR